jgi:hypothetical protein
MSASRTLERLERQCRELGVRLIYDDLRSEGGLCRLRDSYYLIINRRAAVESRVRIISEALVRVEQRPIAPTVEATEPAAAEVRPAAEAPVTERPAAPLVEVHAQK